MSQGKNKKTAPFWQTIPIALIVIGILMMLPMAVIRPASDSQHVAGLFEQHAQTQALVVGTKDYPVLAEGLSDYLFGKAETAQITVEKNGLQSPAFSEDELTHLADVRGLFRLANIVFCGGVVLLIISGLLTAASSSWDPRQALRRFIINAIKGILISLLVLLIVVILASINFHQAFFVMHQLLFTNDLWLLNPQTDLLLMLMQEPFFIAYAKDAGLRLGVVLLGALLALFAASYIIRERRALS